MVSRIGRLLGLLGTSRKGLSLALDLHWAITRMCQEASWRYFGPSLAVEAWGIRLEDLQSLIAPGTKVLDFGCGDGRWTFQSVRLGAFVVATDIDLEKITPRMKESTQSGIQLVPANEMPDFPGHFDLCLLIHVIEHLDDPHTVLTMLRSRTTRLLIETPDIEQDPLNLVRVAFGRPTWTDADHVCEYDLNSLVEVVQDSGWLVEKAWRRAGSLCLLAVSPSSSSHGYRQDCLEVN